MWMTRRSRHRSQKRRPPGSYLPDGLFHWAAVADSIARLRLFRTAALPVYLLSLDHLLYASFTPPVPWKQSGPHPWPLARRATDARLTYYTIPDPHPPKASGPRQFVRIPDRPPVHSIPLADSRSVNLKVHTLRAHRPGTAYSDCRCDDRIVKHHHSATSHGPEPP